MQSFASSFPDPVFSEHMHPHLEVIYPTHPPLPGQIIIGYMIYNKPKSCFVPPCQRPMNIYGFCSSFLFILFFWPLCCLPFCCNFAYDGFQVPVYQ